jgi:hypothetical protein
MHLLLYGLITGIAAAAICIVVLADVSHSTHPSQREWLFGSDDYDER